MADQREDEERDQTGTTLTEGGRGVVVESSPEDNLMRMGTITTSEPAALPPDLDREETFKRIDDRAADDARMEVRRREHSAD
jgi:hypothetical protein